MVITYHKVVFAKLIAKCSYVALKINSFHGKAPLILQLHNNWLVAGQFQKRISNLWFKSALKVVKEQTFTSQILMYYFNSAPKIKVRHNKQRRFSFPIQ